MKETELGRKVLQLELEKEQLLDTIWLATSPKQVKELWTALGELLEGISKPLCDVDQASEVNQSLE